MRLALIFVLLMVIAVQSSAQVDINGYIGMDNRIRIEQNGKYSWNENRLGLKFEGSPSDEIHYFSEVRLRGFGFPAVSQTSDLQRREKDLVYTWGLEFYEAYIDLYGFLTEDLDLRIGRQRIVWGTADRLNPTDNLNPDDLEDLFDFGRHFGSNAIMATYYWGEYTLYGVYIPVFQPAALPYGEWMQAFTPSVELPPGINLVSFQDRIILPENKISETSSLGLKVAGMLHNYDWSLSYYYGRDDLPLMSSVDLTPVDTLGNVAAQADLIYPRMQVVGADMAGSIGSVGVWAEGGLFIHEKVYNIVTFPHPEYGIVTQEEIALDDKPYFKFVVGGDYTFKNNLYINVQFMHGFIHERGNENLHDYILARVQKKFMHDALTIVPFGIVLEIPDWGDIENNYGVAGGPEIAYSPVDAWEIKIGAYLIGGKGNSLFSNVKNLDELFFKIRYVF